MCRKEEAEYGAEQAVGFHSCLGRRITRFNDAEATLKVKSGQSGDAGVLRWSAALCCTHPKLSRYPEPSGRKCVARTLLNRGRHRLRALCSLGIAENTRA